MNANMIVEGTSRFHKLFLKTFFLPGLPIGGKWTTGSGTDGGIGKFGGESLNASQSAWVQFAVKTGHWAVGFTVCSVQCAVCSVQWAM